MIGTTYYMLLITKKILKNLRGGGGGGGRGHKTLTGIVPIRFESSVILASIEASLFLTRTSRRTRQPYFSSCAG